MYPTKDDELSKEQHKHADDEFHKEHPKHPAHDTPPGPVEGPPLRGGTEHIA